MPATVLTLRLETAGQLTLDETERMEAEVLLAIAARRAGGGMCANGKPVRVARVELQRSGLLKKSVSFDGEGNPIEAAGEVKS